MSGGDIDVAPGGILDLDAVMTVMRDSFDPSFGEAWTAPQCAGLLPMPGVWLHVARAGEQPVGFALSRSVAGEAELLLLAVRRHARRLGVGRKLLDGFVSEAARRGAQHLHLEVRDGNDAIRLYTAAGFREIGRRKNYYHGGGGELYDALTLGRKAQG